MRGTPCRLPPYWHNEYFELKATENQQMQEEFSAHFFFLFFLKAGHTCTSLCEGIPKKRRKTIMTREGESALRCTFLANLTKITHPLSHLPLCITQLVFHNQPPKPKPPSIFKIVSEPPSVTSSLSFTSYLQIPIAHENQ